MHGFIPMKSIPVKFIIFLAAIAITVYQSLVFMWCLGRPEECLDMFHPRIATFVVAAAVVLGLGIVGQCAYEERMKEKDGPTKQS